MMTNRQLTILIVILAVLALGCAWLVPWPARAAPDPRLSARWDGAGAATVQWTQTQRGCLSVAHASGERVFLGCFERWPATIVLEVGHNGPVDGTARPAGGDVYILVTNGQSYRASLRGRDVYLAVIRG